MKIKNVLVTFLFLPILTFAMGLPGRTQGFADIHSAEAHPIVFQRPKPKTYKRRNKKNKTGPVLPIIKPSISPVLQREEDTYEDLEQMRRKKKRNALPVQQEDDNLEQGPSERRINRSIEEKLSGIPTCTFLLSQTTNAKSIEDTFILISYQYDLICEIAEKKNIKLDQEMISLFLRRNFSQIPEKCVAFGELVQDLKVIAGFIERFTLTYPQLSELVIRKLRTLLKINFLYLYGILNG